MPLPSLHQNWLNRVLDMAARDNRIDAILGAGSLIHSGLDEWSDLDFVVVCAADTYAEVMAERQVFAAKAGDLLTAFTGEHVGEPRLLICLYGPPLMHVDFKFVVADDLSRMVERPVVLWARDEGALTARLDAAEVAWPDRSPQWFEDRVWTWLHYGATKLHRGELFEAINMLAFLKEQVLGPMLARRAGRDQRGVRRIEQVAGAEMLKRVLPAYDKASIADALRHAADIYIGLRAEAPPERPVAHMPKAVLDFIG